MSNDEKYSLAIIVKLCVFFCTILGVFLVRDIDLSWLLSCGVFFYLAVSPPGRISAALSGAHTPSSIILGVLVIFRFFPTFRTELRLLSESMYNRGLLNARSILLHPVKCFEYVMVPLLLGCLQVADQLSVSAVARGGESPKRRTSYYTEKNTLRDYVWLAGAPIFLVLFLWIGNHLCLN